MSDLKRKLGMTAFCLICITLGFSCPFFAVFQRPCPGCGMTRAVFSLLNGRIGQAFYYHPMVWSLPGLYIFFLRDGRLTGKRMIDIAYLAICAAGFLVNWIVRLTALM